MLPHEPLTKREKEMLIWVGRDKTNGEIAVVIDRSAETVKTHLKHVNEKLGTHTRAGAFVKALLLGEISLSEL